MWRKSCMITLKQLKVYKTLEGYLPLEENLGSSHIFCPMGRVILYSVFAPCFHTIFKYKGFMNVVQSVIGFRKTFQARNRYGFVLFWRRDIHSLCEMQNQAINFRNCKRQLGVKLKEKHYCLLACNEHSVHIFIICTFSFCVAINVLK